MVLIAAVVSVISAIIPPFQSPDEPVHVIRAYLLGKGYIRLETSIDQKTGGYVDKGLMAYIQPFDRLHGSGKQDQHLLHSVSGIGWTGQRIFVPITGAGYYFPLAYTPQALGLLVGEHLDWTVGHSYELARFIALLSTLAAIAVAFSISPRNDFVLGLLMLPMTIFQMASASLDGFTLGLTVLCAALFMRATQRARKFPSWMSWCLTICVLTLATSRTQLLPLLALPFVTWTIRRQTAILWQGGAVLLFVLGWTTYAVHGSYVARTGSALSNSDVIWHYLKNPGAIAEAVYHTVVNPVYYKGYWISFIGVLGWLDVILPIEVYRGISAILVLLFLLSINYQDIRAEWRPRLLLLALAASAAALVFFALLVTYSALDGKAIEGVQGRYFLPPLILVGYAIGRHQTLPVGGWVKPNEVLLLVLGGIVIYMMPRVLLERYYMIERIAPSEDVYQVRPSPALGSQQSIRLSFTTGHQAKPNGLKRIGIRFGTYRRNNTGDAELRLSGPTGEHLVVPFKLAELSDNQYRFFDLDSRRYTSGEIRAISGGGISAWESRKASGEIYTCLIYEYDDGFRDSTPGCRWN